MSTVTIEGMDGVIGEIKKLTNDRMKRLEIIKILRRQVKPILSAVKAKTPVADEDIKFRKTDLSSREFKEINGNQNKSNEKISKCFSWPKKRK
jgi:hypothetical protein